jgi:hypothetical protein
MSLSPEDQAKIGGSDLAALLGLSPWGTPLTLYARIVTALEGRPLKDEDSAPKRRGRVLESAVLRLYAEETGAMMLGGARFTHPRFPGRASVDSLADRAGRRVVEAKTAGLSEVRQWGEAGTDAIPQGYLFQCTWYLGHALAAGAVDTKEADVAALVAGDLRVYHVPYDTELFEMLEAAAERFWVDHVLPRRPPPVTEPLKDVGAVGSLYPRHAGDARQFDSFGPSEQTVVLEYLRARRERKQAEELEAAWESRLKLALGTIPRLEGLPPDTGAKALTWRQNKPTQVTDWKAVAEELRGDVGDRCYLAQVERHTTTKDGARPLRVSEREDEE